jgi:hypothetical protein
MNWIAISSILMDIIKMEALQALEMEVTLMAWGLTGDMC